jgi:ketosteroid isomerase-like protein
MSPTEFMQMYEAATCAHDLERTLSLIAEDAVFLFSDNTAHIGKSAVKTALSNNFAAITDETYRLHGIRWIATSDNVAACIYQYGQPASGSGRGTSVIRREGGGWVVAHEHLSAGNL